MTQIPGLFAILALCLGIAVSLDSRPFIPEHVVSETKVTVSSTPIVTDFEGFGSSLSWWAKFAGSLPDAQLDDFLSQVYNVSYSPTSLGLSIVRYNIGGSHNSQSSRYDPYKLIESFWNGPAESDWDWNVDQEQRRVLQKSKVFGALTFEAFCNSPPWWMTFSKDARGSHVGPIDNLKPEHFGRYADYLIKVVQKFRNEWGVPFTSISPFNEPNGLYWHTVFRNATQEGCVFLPATQSRFLTSFYPKLQQSGLIQSCPPVAHEAYTLRYAFWNLRLGANYNWADKVNIHGYGHERSIEDPLSHNKDRLRFRQSIEKKKPNNVQRFWMSETGGFGLGREAMLRIAQTIMYDLNIMAVKGWVYWQVLDADPRWPLFDTPLPWSADTFNPRLHPQGWGLLHFSRHVRPGDLIYSHSGIALAGCTLCSLVSSNAKGSRLSVILLNMDANSVQNFSLDLSQVPHTSLSSLLVFQSIPDENKWYNRQDTFQPNTTYTFRHSTLEIPVIPPFSLTSIVIE